MNIHILLYGYVYGYVSKPGTPGEHPKNELKIVFMGM